MDCASPPGSSPSRRTEARACRTWSSRFARSCSVILRIGGIQLAIFSLTLPKSSHILIHPIQVTLCNIENKLRLSRTVRSPRIDHHLRGDALPFKRVIQLVTLRSGYAHVSFSVQDQRRRL